MQMKRAHCIDPLAIRLKRGGCYQTINVRHLLLGRGCDMPPDLRGETYNRIENLLAYWRGARRGSCPWGGRGTQLSPLLHFFFFFSKVKKNHPIRSTQYQVVGQRGTFHLVAALFKQKRPHVPVVPVVPVEEFLHADGHK